MRKSLIVVSIITAALLFSSTVFASSWTPPSNVRIVQKYQPYTTNVYSTIKAALDSITNASATNPYVVKVMPGIYDLATASVHMKEYVDLEGSGPENTIITSSNNNVDDGTCTVGTVLMANNSAIRNIKVVNTAPALNGNWQAAVAVAFYNVTAKAEGISILVGRDTVEAGRNNGICSSGASAHAILNNVYVETRNNGGQSNPIYLVGDASVTLTNSKLAAFNTTGSIDTINNNGSWVNYNQGKIEVMNSIIEGTRAGGAITGLFVDGYKTSILNSTIVMNVGSESSATALYTGIGDFTMANSKIICDGAVNYYGADATIKIANSLLPGNRTGLIGAKCVNNYDENYDPISNCLQ